MHACCTCDEDNSPHHFTSHSTASSRWVVLQHIGTARCASTQDTQLTNAHQCKMQNRLSAVWATQTGLSHCSRDLTWHHQSAAATAATASAGADPLILCDISSPLQPRSYAPNPSKARLALSFKRVPFETTWIDILDIPDVRKGLNCPAVRKLDDGSDYYTLPMLQVLLPL